MNITIAPRWASSSLFLTGTSFVDCGTPPVLSSLSSFTLEAWIKPGSTNGFQSIVGNVDNAIGGQYQLFMDGGYLVGYVGIPPYVVQSKTQISAGEWHHVASTYDATSSTLTLYVDGEVVAQTVFTSGQLPKNGTNVLIGAVMQQNSPTSFFTGEVGRVMIWNIARTAEDILNDSVQVNVYNATENPNLIFYSDFSVLPIVDSSGNNISLNMKNSPNAYLNVPSVVLGSNGYVDCGSYADYSFPANDPYTIEGWVFPTNSSGGCIVSYGNASNWEYRILYQQNTIVVERNSDTGKITSNSFIVPNSYYHFAAVYDETVKSLSLYVNGNLQIVDYFPSAVAGVSNGHVLIGAQYNSGGNIGNFFNGSVQNIRIWNVALEQSEVFQWMYNDVINDNRLVSNYDFTVDPPIDNTDKATLDLLGGASQTIQQLSIPFTEPVTQLGLPQSFNAVYLNQNTETPTPPPNDFLFAKQPELFSSEHLEQSWNDFIAGSSFKQKEGQRKVFDEAFTRAKQMMDENPNLKKGFTRTDLNGLTRVVYHGPQGDMLVYEDAIGAVDDCTLWWIQFVFQLTVGFYQALGLLPKTGDIATRVYNLVRANATVMNALTSLTGKAITVSSAVGIIAVIYQQGLMWTIIKFIFTSAGWYALFWILKKAIAIATGLEAAELLAGFIIWAAQLTNTSLNYNSKCGQKLVSAIN